MHTNVDQWDEDSPYNTEGAGFSGREIRLLRGAVRSRLEKEHEKPDVDGAGGEHKPGSAVFYFQDEEPTTKPDGSTVLDADDYGRVWIDSDADPKHLYVYWDDAWNDLGTVELSGLLLSGDSDSYASPIGISITDSEAEAPKNKFRIAITDEDILTIQGRNEDDDDWVDIIHFARGETPVITADVALTMGAAISMGSTNKITDIADPTEDQDVASKNYVDDTIADTVGSGVMSPLAYAGEESVTLPNGLIIKGGVTGSISGDSFVELTYGTPFPHGILTMQCTMNNKNPLADFSPQIQQKSGSELSVAEVSNPWQGGTITAWWLVIGW